LNTATVEAVEHRSTGPNEADTFNGVAVSLSGNMVAAAFANQRAELRAADSGAILATLPTPNVELQAVHSARTAPRWPWQAWRPRLTGTSGMKVNAVALWRITEGRRNDPPAH
jgi:hypothetical protein